MLQRPCCSCCYRRARGRELEAQKQAAAAARDFKQAAQLSAQGKAALAEATSADAQIDELRDQLVQAAAREAQVVPQIQAAAGAVAAARVHAAAARAAQAEARRQEVGSAAGAGSEELGALETEPTPADAACTREIDQSAQHAGGDAAGAAAAAASTVAPTSLRREAPAEGLSHTPESSPEGPSRAGSAAGDKLPPQVEELPPAAPAAAVAADDRADSSDDAALFSGLSLA